MEKQSNIMERQEKRRKLYLGKEDEIAILNTETNELTTAPNANPVLLEENDPSIDQGGPKTIWEAIESGSLPAVECYLNENPLNISLKNESEFSSTLLHHASIHGNLEIVQYLISKGAEIDACDIYDCTPLNKASHKGHVSIINCLLDHGANINHQNKMSESSLHDAVYGKHTEAIKVLIKRGADKSLEDNRHRTPLKLAKLLKFNTPIVFELTS